MVLSDLVHSKRLHWWLIFLASLVPAVWLVQAVILDPLSLGADPAKEIVDFLGTWALQMLWISLAVTPVRRLGWSGAIRYRRMLGLYALFYAVLHMLAFATFILGWNLALLKEEVIERPYMVVGALALLILIPLGITSTKKMQRRLGKRWVSLHKSVYLAALLVMLHVIWLIRASYFDAALYGGILALLLGYRVYLHYRKSVRSNIRTARTPG